MPGKHQNSCGHTVGADALTNIDSTEVRKIPVEDDEVMGGIGLALDLLLDNALRYGDGSHPIQLQLRRLDQQKCVQIAIKNHGTGVPVSESMLKSWLNPFIRGGLIRDGRQVEGAGLCLALARELVMAWKGTLALEQSALMDGSLTTALLTLPISQAAGDGGGPVDAQKDRV